MLAAEIGALDAADFDLQVLGFDDQALDRMLASLEPEDGEPAADEDDSAVPEPPPVATAATGDVWRLGGHRLACGDAGDAALVKALMQGEQAALCFTSPPYSDQRLYTEAHKSGDWLGLMQRVFRALPMRADGQVLVNLGLVHEGHEWLPYWDGWLEWMRQKGWRRYGLYVWDQGFALPGNWAGRLGPAFELVFHFNREARPPNRVVPCGSAGRVKKTQTNVANSRGVRPIVGGFTTSSWRSSDSVIRINRQVGAIGEGFSHPAVFPVALPLLLLRSYSDRGEICYEPFSGSGTSLIAAERCGRRMRAVELAPEYVDVALQRWCQTFPRVVPVLEASGERWPDVSERRRAEQQATQTPAPGVES
jgi:DNA modification methylase